MTELSGRRFPRKKRKGPIRAHAQINLGAISCNTFLYDLIRMCLNVTELHLSLDFIFYNVCYFIVLLISVFLFFFAAPQRDCDLVSEEMNEYLLHNIPV